jgi:outer membrane murein-binding lipoprotein Lpp
MNEGTGGRGMDNDQLLLTLKDLFDQKMDEYKRHVGVLQEDMDKKFKMLAEGQNVLHEKIDALGSRMDTLETKVDAMEIRLSAVEDTLHVVHNYVVRVDEKLNEHDRILKRVK